MCGGVGWEGRGGDVGESMGNESSKLIVGFAVPRTRSGQSSSSISLSLQSDLSRGMRKQIFPGLLLQRYNWLYAAVG